MQQIFTSNRQIRNWKSWIIATVILLSASFAKAQVLFSESFTTVVPLPAGWGSQNLSSPLGTTGWFQGNPAVFPANSGATNAYIGASFNNTAGAGTISNWLFTPSITVKNGDQLTFFTRKSTPAPDDYPDRLQVRLSTNGTSVNVGATATSVGDYSSLLLDVNPTLVAGGYPLTWTKFTVNIIGVPVPVTGRLAFRYFVTDGGPAGNNSDFIGIDDVVYSAFTGPCTGAPTPGNTIATPASVCPSLSFSLTLQNPPTTSGNTYQWQSGPSNVGPWTNIIGATNISLTTSQVVATWYRCNVTCVAGPVTTTSNPVQVNMNLPTACYCTPPASNCSFSDVITNVSIDGMSNSSTCSVGPPTGYGNFTTTVPPGNFYSGGINPMRVTVGPGGTEYVGVWIDYNKSGGFEANEFTALGNGNGVTIAGNINVPATALPGATRMRVRVRYNTPLTSTDDCATYSFGETEDYTVNISPCVSAVVVTAPANASTFCSGGATFTTSISGSVVNFQWQEKIGAAPWANLSNSGVYSGVTTNTLTLTNVPTTMSGYQYRVLFSGACTSPDFTAAATLTVTPLTATVNPTSATICTGTVIPLTLTNATSPTTVTFTNSTPLVITDGNQFGVMSTINVAGIPAGVTISNISVRLNSLTHTYVGDLDINLIAPNGGNLNLVGGLDNGGGGNSSNDFTNTVISSTGTVALSGFAAPRTGTFAADRRNGYGPTGNTQTTNNWNNLTSTMNGAWKLALADFFTPDPGTLNSWSLIITYGSPATGVWTASPTSPNTMFTDNLGTVAYIPGSQATTIFVKPTVNTTYSVVHANSTPCTTPPTNIPVSVSNPVTNVVNPVNATTCINGNVTFTTSASGNPLTYQWQISTNGGTTYTDIVGATSATLNVNGVLLSMSNNRYRSVITVAPCGSVNTTGAILTVNPLPVIAISSPVISLLPGRTTTITATSIPGATYSWTRNGKQVGGNTNTILVNVDGVGVYRATVTTNGCSNTSAELFIGSEVSDRLWIYPNPSTDGNFQVRLYDFSGTNKEERIISIYKNNGQLVTSKEFFLLESAGPYQAMDFNLSNLAAGIYIVKVYNKSSGKVVSGQVVIK
ncbi:MAG: choice-of-anchor J domain-containing protein [Bacteroidota bacterium]|nr:choice-of-anchor J domain-containing protein [Bacteroidota bacterium]